MFILICEFLSTAVLRDVKEQGLLPVMKVTVTVTASNVV